MYDASQFGQLNRLTRGFWYVDPDVDPREQLGRCEAVAQAMVIRRVIRTHKSATFYLQVGREQPVTLALLPVESCEML